MTLQVLGSDIGFGGVSLVSKMANRAKAARISSPIGLIKAFLPLRPFQSAAPSAVTPYVQTPSGITPAASVTPYVNITSAGVPAVTTAPYVDAATDIPAVTTAPYVDAATDIPVVTAADAGTSAATNPVTADIAGIPAVSGSMPTLLLIIGTGIGFLYMFMQSRKHSSRSRR